MIKRILFILICVVSLNFIYGQDGTFNTAGILPSDIPLHNSLKYNRFLFNPTFSLVRENKNSINIYNRNPRSSFNDNSQTYFLNYSARFEEKTGVGIGLFQQNVGIFRFFGATLNYAYNLEINRDMNFTFGVNLNYSQSSLKSNLDEAQINDDVINNYENNSVFLLRPGVNFNYGKFDVGVSVGNLVAYNLTGSELLTDNFDYSGHVMYTTELDWRTENELRGMVYASKPGEQNLRYGGNVLFEIPKYGWAQLGYNSFYGGSIGIGANITKVVSIGYTVEPGIGGDANVAEFGATHEFGLAFNFAKEEKRKRRRNFSSKSSLQRDSEIRRLKKEILDQNKIIRELQRTNSDSLSQAQRSMNKLERSIQEAKEEEARRARELSLQREEEVKLLNKQAEELAAQQKLELEMTEQRAAEEAIAAEEAAKAAAEAEGTQAEEARIAAEEAAREAEAEKQEAAAEAVAEAKRQAEVAAAEAEAKKQTEIAEAAAQKEAEEQLAAQKKLELELAQQKEEEERLASQKKLEMEIEEQRRREESQKTLEREITQQKDLEAEAARLAEEERQRQEAEAARLAEEERQRQEAEAARLAEEERQRQEAEAQANNNGEDLNEIQKELDNNSRITDKLIASRDSLLTSTKTLDKREFTRLLESLVNMSDEAEEIKSNSDPSSSKRLTSKNRFIKFADATRPEAKYATKFIPGYPEGYYLIGNVFKGGVYADSFTNKLKDLGFNDAEVILNPENQFQYVSIKYYEDKNEAAENYLNSIGNKYFGDMWILHIAKNRVESLKRLVQETRIIKDTVKDDTVLSESLSYIGGHDIQNGYYLITDIYKRENYFERGLSRLKSQGLEPKFFRNPKDNYIYVYLDRFDSLDKAKQSLFSNVNNTYDGELYILKIE